MVSSSRWRYPYGEKESSNYNSENITSIQDNLMKLQII